LIGFYTENIFEKIDIDADITNTDRDSCGSLDICNIKMILPVLYSFSRDAKYIVVIVGN
jgi:hypothetical protein